MFQTICVTYCIVLPTCSKTRLLIFILKHVKMETLEPIAHISVETAMILPHATRQLDTAQTDVTLDGNSRILFVIQVSNIFLLKGK